MTKKIIAFLFVMCLTINAVGCALPTTGEASWELYAGFHTKQISKTPAKIEIESTVVDKVVDLFTKSHKTKEE